MRDEKQLKRHFSQPVNATIKYVDNLHYNYYASFADDSPTETIVTITQCRILLVSLFIHFC